MHIQFSEIKLIELFIDVDDLLKASKRISSRGRWASPANPLGYRS